MEMFNPSQFNNVPFHDETKRNYEKLHKIIQKGERPGMDHGHCVLQEEWSEVATDLYNHTCEWIDRNEVVNDVNQRAVKDIRLNNKQRLEYIIIRAASKYNEFKYEICMELLHVTLADEMIAIHHLDMIANQQIKNYCDELNEQYQNLLMWDCFNPLGMWYN